MKKLPVKGRTLALLAVILPLMVLFIYVSLRSGPLAPIPVTVSTVENRSVTPALFGIGTVEARYTYKIGPTMTGRLRHLFVNVGDHVKAGQVLGQMDPVDIDDRIRSLEAAVQRARAQLHEAEARQDFARTQATRYKKLSAMHTVSEEIAAGKMHELKVAETVLEAVRAEGIRVRSDLQALKSQRGNLDLIAPSDSLVVRRSADPGTAVAAGQAVIELIDPESPWIHARFDQVSADGLQPGLAARIILRSRNSQVLTGTVLRLEPLADPVTEELMAKVVFDQVPEPLPPMGELAEVTIMLPELPAAPVILNAAIHRINGVLGVWRIEGDSPAFAPIVPGITDLEGHVQIRSGLEIGDRIIVYSNKPLTAHSRIHIVDAIPERL